MEHQHIIKKENINVSLHIRNYSNFLNEILDWDSFKFFKESDLRLEVTTNNFPFSISMKVLTALLKTRLNF